MSEVFSLSRGGELPLLVSVPHTGVEVPEELESRMAEGPARDLPDTDWHLHRLYSFVTELGGTLLCARYSRYVIDLNRSPESVALYPGRDETGLVPTSTFGRDPIWREGEEPDEAEILERRERFWQPYHDALHQELARIRDAHGVAYLFDAHSITSRVPRFFDGELPGLILGDAEGAAADAGRSAAVLDALRTSPHEVAHNAPFKGGYITRSCGRPSEGVHALQLEMSQRLYMDEGPPFAWREDLAAALRPTLVAAIRAFVS